MASNILQNGYITEHSATGEFVKAGRLTLIVMIDRSCLLNMLQARRGVIKPS